MDEQVRRLFVSYAMLESRVEQLEVRFVQLEARIRARLKEEADAARS